MKKTGIFFSVLFFLFYYERYEVIDVRNYQSAVKSVEVKGEVQHPGVYQLERHANVEKAIKASGGLTKQADISGLNLTMDIEHHGVLVVPSKHRITKISINAATLEELDTLPGIGPSIAQRIVEYRKQMPFQTLEDLKQVKGIGDKLFDKIKEHISL